MFERYTETARRVIFFARYEAGQVGAHQIEPEHILLALLRESRSLISPEETTVQSIIEEIRREMPSPAAAISTSVDLPLSPAAKRSLDAAAAEAKEMGHRHIGSEHLLLGLLKEPASLAVRLLGKHGIDHQTVWREVSEGRIASALVGRQRLHALVDELPDGALEDAEIVLRRLKLWASRPSSVWGLDMGPLEASSMAWHPELHHREGQHFSFSHMENNDTLVVETHRFFRGHEIVIIERLGMTQYGKTLSYRLEIHGPGQAFNHSIDFSVS